MGNIDSITARLRSERRDVPISTSLSAFDSDTLDDFVDFLSSHGVPSTRTAAVRALILDGLEAFREFQAEQKPNSASDPERRS